MPRDMTRDELLADLLSDEEARESYDALAEEYALYRKIIKARADSHVSQAEVARRMGTTRSAISRLESSNAKHSPSIGLLKRYADALGYQLEINLIPKGAARKNGTKGGRPRKTAI